MKSSNDIVRELVRVICERHPEWNPTTKNNALMCMVSDRKVEVEIENATDEEMNNNVEAYKRPLLFDVSIQYSSGMETFTGFESSDEDLEKTYQDIVEFIEKERYQHQYA